MTEVPDGSGPVSRRSPRASDGGAPISGALAIVLAAVAVIAGFLILRSISDDGDNQLGIESDTDGTGGTDTAPDSTLTPGSTLTPAPTPTTAPALVTDGATVVVANANGISGSAATMSRALETGPGFTMGDPTDGSSATGTLEATVIYYDPAQPAAQPVADSVARAMGGATVLALTSTPPVASGDLGGAGVLVMLGVDKANKTLEELNPTTNTAPVVVTNPPLTSTG